MTPQAEILYCHPLLLMSSVFPSTKVFSNESVLLIRWPKYWSLNFSISPSNEHPGLISFRMDWPNLLVIPSVSWLPTFSFQSPIMRVLVLEGLVGLHRTLQLQLLQHYWLGHRLGLLWYWMVCLGNEQRSFCRFWDCIQVLHFRLFCLPWWLLHFF